MLTAILATPECPVQLYKEYARRRPTDCNLPDSRFYLQPIAKPKSDIWYSRQPMGKNTLKNIAKKMAIVGGLGKKSNHSARKTAIQTLLHANVNPTDVVQITGHKNVQSLNAYSHHSNEQQKAISNVLSTTTSSHVADEASTSNCCFPGAVNVSSSNTTDVAMHNDELDDATVSELMNDWDPITSDLDLSINRNTSNMSAMSRHTPSFSFLNGAVHGNVTININYTN